MAGNNAQLSSAGLQDQDRPVQAGAQEELAPRRVQQEATRRSWI